MVSSFPKMQKSSASFSQSIRNRLRLKNLQAQAKNFCRVLDIRVPQIMEANFWPAKLLCKLLDPPINRTIIQMLADAVGEYKVHIVILEFAAEQMPLSLSGFHLPQKLQHLLGGNNGSDLAVLCGNKFITTADPFLAHALKLLMNEDG